MNIINSTSRPRLFSAKSIATELQRKVQTARTMLPSSSKMYFHADFSRSKPGGLEADASAVFSLSLGMQLNLKQLKLWFSTWHEWQKRVAVCRIIENCTKANLESLATSLEPVLHLDFSTSLSPLMAAVHLEGSRTFRIQRAADYTLPSTIAPAVPLPKKEDPLFSESFTKHNLQSTPSFLQSMESNVQMKKSSGYFSISSKPEQVFLPEIPSTHSKHKLSPASSDFNQSTISQRSSSIELSHLHRPYNSVPDIRSTVDLLKMAKRHNSTRGTKATRRRHQQSKSMSFTHMESKRMVLQRKHRQLELYKSQLNFLSQWIEQCQVGEITLILLDIIKISDRTLLGYLVQCLYHRLQLKRGIDSLSDKLVLKIFSHLDPASLLKCRMVCLHWYYLAGKDFLWKQHCSNMASTEGIGNVVGAIEAVHRVTSAEGKVMNVIYIDWLQAYKDLSILIDKIKSMIRKSIGPISEDCSSSITSSGRPLTSSQLRSTCTLRDLIDSIRDSSRVSNLSTQEVVLLAPESATAMRRRLRAERRQLKQQQLLHDAQIKNELILNQPDDEGRRNMRVHQYPHNTTTLNCGLDKRPSIPSLPNPVGIQCLILAGFLLPNETVRPGKASSIPKLGRVELPEVSVLCLECDERKIIAGCSDRIIRVYDIRSGREVATLTGHKGSVQCLQFDDNKIVSGSWDTTCIVWDLVHYTVLKILIGHTECVSCLKFHESTLVTGSYDHCIKIWEATSWDCLHTIYPAHKKPITCLAFNGISIFSGSEDKTVKIWNPLTGSREAVLSHESRVTAMVLSKLLLITSSSDGVMNLWDLRTKTIIMQWSTEYDIAHGAVTSISLDKGKIYAAASDSMVYEWDIATGTCIRSLQAHSTALTCVWAGCNRIVTASEDHSIAVWNTKKACDGGFIPIVDSRTDQPSFYATVPVKVVTVDDD